MLSDTLNYDEGQKNMVGWEEEEGHCHKLQSFSNFRWSLNI